MTDTERTPETGALGLTVLAPIRIATRWQEQYARMKRWCSRITEATSADSRDVDDVYAFFVCCYHLKNWIKNDDSLDTSIRDGVESGVSDSTWLSPSGDITNGFAHGPDRCTVKAKGERKCPCHAEYVKVPEQVAVVERVFAMAASGLGNRRIADTLAAEHIPAPDRVGWAKTIIRNMRSNRIYVGEVVFGRTRSGESTRGRHRRVEADGSQQPELRIISDKLWAQVQKRRAATLERYSPHRNTDGKLHGRPEAGLIAAP